MDPQLLLDKWVLAHVFKYLQALDRLIWLQEESKARIGKQLGREDQTIARDPPLLDRGVAQQVNHSGRSTCAMQDCAMILSQAHAGILEQDGCTEGSTRRPRLRTACRLGNMPNEFVSTTNELNYKPAGKRLQLKGCSKY